MRENVTLTESQRRVLQAFQERAREGVPPPTLRELCAQFGWSSTAAPRDHIRVLVRKGMLDPARRKARGTQLRMPQANAVHLPLVGRIVAGRPVLSQENIEKEVAVPSFLVPRATPFLLRVHGDSMEAAGILDGDYVVVMQTSDPREGDIAAVTVDGETTLKRLARSGRTWTLVAENPRYKPIEIRTEDVTVHGVVTGLIRSLDGRNP